MSFGAEHVHLLAIQGGLAAADRDEPLGYFDSFVLVVLTSGSCCGCVVLTSLIILAGPAVICLSLRRMAATPRAGSTGFLYSGESGAKLLWQSYRGLGL